MKLFHPLIIAGCGAVLLCGCATSPARPAGAPHSSQSSGAPGAADDSEEGRGALPVAQGTPEGLAHFAAGVSYGLNDSPELALRQFEDSVLADPSNEGLALELGRDLLKKQHPRRAARVLSKAAQRPNASGELLSWLGRADLQAGKTNEALGASRLAIQRAPKSLDGYESLLEVLFRTGQSAEALKTLDAAAKNVHTDPLSFVALADLYSVYLKNPHYVIKPADAQAITRRAVALLDRAAAKTLSARQDARQDLELWRRMGDVYNRLDQPRKAAEIYARLVESEHEPSILRNDLRGELANLYLQAQDRTNAVKQLQAIVRDAPERYPGAWYALGRLAYEEANLAEAADDFENALHWDPGLEGAYFELALVQMDLHRTEDAFRTLDQARSRFPNTFDGEFVTGLVYSHSKNYAEAVRHFTTAEVIGLATDRKRLDQRFYFPFAAACERNQQFQQAEEYLQKCIDMAPDFAEALNYLGYMWADRGEHLDKARGLIEKALKMEPKNGAYMDSLGWVLFKLKQPRQALPWLLKALEDSPEPDATVLDHLGEVYMALGQPDKAREAWKKSLSLESNEAIKKKLQLIEGGAS